MYKATMLSPFLALARSATGITICQTFFNSVNKEAQPVQGFTKGFLQPVGSFKDPCIFRDMTCDMVLCHQKKKKILSKRYFYCTKLLLGYLGSSALTTPLTLWPR